MSKPLPAPPAAPQQPRLTLEQSRAIIRAMSPEQYRAMIAAAASQVKAAVRGSRG